MTFKIISYEYYPCQPHIFTINGLPADIYKFGTFESTYGDDIDEIICAEHEFVPFDTPKDGVLETYNITLQEYKQICEELQSELYVENCALCM